LAARIALWSASCFLTPKRLDGAPRAAWPSAWLRAHQPTQPGRTVDLQGQTLDNRYRVGEQLGEGADAGGRAAHPCADGGADRTSHARAAAHLGSADHRADATAAPERHSGPAACLYADASAPATRASWRAGACSGRLRCLGAHAFAGVAD